MNRLKKYIAMFLVAALVTVWSSPGYGFGFEDLINVGKQQVQQQIDQSVYQQIGDALGLKAPVHLDARHSFPAVSAPSDFKPQKLRLEDLGDLNTKLPAGDYVMDVIAYCTKYSVHRPGRGVSYTLAPAEGSKIKAIAALAIRGEMAHLDRGLLQNVNMTIQTGLPLSQWRDEYRQVVHQLIPEFESDLRGDVLDEYKAEYERVRGTIPVQLPGFDGILSHIPLGQQVLEIKKAREVLTDRSISAQEVGDRLYQATAPNDGLPQTFTPNEPKDSSWVAVRPGVMARFTVVNGRAGDGSSGINTLEFRITKEASDSSAKTKRLKLAQAAEKIPVRTTVPVLRRPAQVLDFPVRPTQIGVGVAEAVEAAETTELGISIAEILFGTIFAPEVLVAGAAFAVAGLIAYSIDTPTQSLTIAPAMEKGGKEHKGAVVYVWTFRGKNEAWGHTSMRLNDADKTHISWWPSNVRYDKMPYLPDVYTADPIQNQTFQDDIKLEEQKPDIVIPIPCVDEEKIKTWWLQFKGTHKWKTLTQNCSTTVKDALYAGGAADILTTWQEYVGSGSRFVWTPNKINALAKALAAQCPTTTK